MTHLPDKPLTPEQFKQQLRQWGITLTKWAKDRGLHPKKASQVLNGNLKGNYGEAHRYAVAMGLKTAPAELTT